jgi:Aerotolerance regulator N-terminal
MRFPTLSPGDALILLVAAAVVLLYLLKPSPRRVAVSSILIWRQVLRARGRAPDRLRWWVSLFLAVSIALLLALTLIRSQLGTLGAAAERVALVLDNSATLATSTPDGGTRWEHAVECARRVLNSGGAGSRYLVEDTQRTIASPRFEESEAALATVGRLRVVPGGRPEFPGVLEAMGPGIRSVLVTDGVAALSPPRGTETCSVFQLADNVGITAFDVRPAPGYPGRYQGFVEVLNASPGAKRVELRVAGAGQSPITRLLEMPGTTTASEMFELSAFDNGALRASVRTPGDALAGDDDAYAYLPSNKAIRVGLVTAGDSFLERSLRVLPRTQVSVVPPQRVGARSDVDIWVFEHYAPEQAPGAPALVFRPRPVGWLPAPEGELGATGVAAWERGHPVTDGLSLRDVLADRALRLRAGAGVQVLATDVDGHPLVLASASGPRWVVVAFALPDSNFALQTGFPVFLSNAMEWMAREPVALHSGLGLVRIPMPDAEVVDLQGQHVATHKVSDATLFEAEQSGLYTAIAGDRRVRVAVNVADPAVTSVNASRPAAQPAAIGWQAPRWAAKPWPVLLLTAVLLLLLEWWTYNRRLTV